MPNVYSHKVCAICGKSQSSHWGRHWSRNHPNSEIKELALGEVPSSPFKDNWIDLIEPEDLQNEYKKAAN